MIHLVFEIIFMCATEMYISKCLKYAVDLMTWSVSNCQRKPGICFANADTPFYLHTENIEHFQ